MIVTRGLGPGALLPTMGLGTFPSIGELVFAKRDVLGITDSLVLQQDWVRTEVDTINALDVFAAQQHWVRELIDTIVVNDLIAAQRIPLFVIRAGTMTLRNDAYVSLTLADE